MSAFNTSALRRLRSRKAAVAGVAVAASAAVALSLAPGDAEAGTTAEVAAAPAAWKANPEQAAKVQESIATQQTSFEAQFKAAQAKKKAEAEAAKKAAEAKKKAAAKAAAEKRAKEKAAADRSARAAAKPAKVTYPNNLDGWIREALSIMKKHDIPGSYEGIHRNIMRESSGNPRAINNWDINAINGVPSKGLLQVIKPTFDAYHVPGTKKDQYDPVANIVAACNYAADRYGSMDNVNSAY